MRHQAVPENQHVESHCLEAHAKEQQAETKPCTQEVHSRPQEPHASVQEVLYMVQEQDWWLWLWGLTSVTCTKDTRAEYRLMS